jgi:hypothetical protein
MLAQTGGDDFGIKFKDELKPMHQEQFSRFSRATKSSFAMFSIYLIFVSLTPPF